MIMFEVNDEVYEVKLTFESIKYLNGKDEGGAFAFIQKALSGDLDTYVDIIFAGLFHTEKGFTRKDIEKAVEEGIINEQIDLAEVNSTCYGIVSESFFYKQTFRKMFPDEESRQEMDELMK